MAVATARLRRTGIAISNGNSPLTGQPFLTRNSATFEDVTTFRQDYTALLVESCRRKPVKPLPPASVIHKNFPYLTMQGSLTQNTYKPPKVLTSKDLQLGQGEEGQTECDRSSKRMPNKMFATNFHLNADRRLDTHGTTTQEGFPPLVPAPLSDLHKFAHYKDIDSGPLGQRVFNPSAESEYSSVFNANNKSGKDKPGAEDTRLPPLKTNGANTPRNTLTGILSLGCIQKG